MEGPPPAPNEAGAWRSRRRLQTGISRDSRSLLELPSDEEE